MKYNTLSDHDEVFEIPGNYTNSPPMWIGITHIGAERDAVLTGDYRSRFAYSIATGPYDADVQYQGDDLRGPAIGGVTESDMAATLMGFLSAYAEGDLRVVPDDIDGFGTRTELYFDGDVVATGETAEFIHANGFRFGRASSELEEGYLAWSTDYFNETLDRWVYKAVPTGKEDE